MYGYLHIKTDEQTLNYKIASGLYDTFDEAFKIYTAVIKLNPDAARSISTMRMSSS